MEKKKNSRLLLKIVGIVMAAIIVIAAALGISFVSVWHNEISTISSFKHLRDRNDENKEGSVYFMDVAGGFYFDDFIAQGGASNDKELINFITNNITRGLIDMTIKETDIGCSSFTAVAENGDVLFGRNYDFDKTNICMLVSDPGNGRHKSFSTVDLNYVGMDIDKDVEGLMNKITCLAAPYAPLDGINDAGVSCGIYMSYQGDETVATNQQDKEKANITSTTMLRMILDYADNVDEAVELVQSYNLHDSANTSFHYMVADASGKSAILEWLPESGTDRTDNDGTARKFTVTYNTDPMYETLRESSHFKYQWITNFIVHEGYYLEGDDAPGTDRYQFIHDELYKRAGKVKDEKEAMQILAGVGRRTWGEGGGCTVHSVVYNLTQKTITWVANENYNDPSATFEFKLSDL